MLSSVLDLWPRTEQQLADELGMHRNNMVSLIDELEANGWACRVRSDTDRRAYRIELTAAGRRVAERASRAVPILDDDVTRTLTAREHAELADLLGKVAEAAGLSPGVHPHLTRRTMRQQRAQTQQDQSQPPRTAELFPWSRDRVTTLPSATKIACRDRFCLRPSLTSQRRRPGRRSPYGCSPNGSASPGSSGIALPGTTMMAPARMPGTLA